jgi:hypothetical protein
MTTLTIQLDDAAAESLHRLAEQEQRSPTEIVRDALTAYTMARRPLPKGDGKYRSGRTDVSGRAKEILRDAAKEGRCPRARTADRRRPDR